MCWNLFWKLQGKTPWTSSSCHPKTFEKTLGSKIRFAHMTYQPMQGLQGQLGPPILVWQTINLISQHINLSLKKLGGLYDYTLNSCFSQLNGSLISRLYINLIFITQSPIKYMALVVRPFLGVLSSGGHTCPKPEVFIKRHLGLEI